MAEIGNIPRKSAKTINLGTFFMDGWGLGKLSDQPRIDPDGRQKHLIRAI